METKIFNVVYTHNDYKAGHIHTCVFPPHVFRHFVDAVECVGLIADMAKAEINERYNHVSADGTLHAFRADYEGGYIEVEIWEMAI